MSPAPDGHTAPPPAPEVSAGSELPLSNIPAARFHLGHFHSRERRGHCSAHLSQPQTRASPKLAPAPNPRRGLGAPGPAVQSRLCPTGIPSAQLPTAAPLRLLCPARPRAPLHHSPSHSQFIVLLWHRRRKTPEPREISGRREK